jgi:hypothetical protein
MCYKLPNPNNYAFIFFCQRPYKISGCKNICLVAFNKIFLTDMPIYLRNMRNNGIKFMVADIFINELHKFIRKIIKYFSLLFNLHNIRL